MNPAAFHFVKSIFGEDADEFKPGRWFRPEAKEMERYMFQFGQGTRQCIGKNVRSHDTLFPCIQANFWTWARLLLRKFGSFCRSFFGRSASSLSIPEPNGRRSTIGSLSKLVSMFACIEESKEWPADLLVCWCSSIKPEKYRISTTIS